MDTRHERIGKNEALFREVNERISDISSYADEAEFLCECGDEACTLPITLTLAEYESLRAEPTHFAIVPGHERPDAERVIAVNDRYAVVEKHAGDPAALASELDPRS